MWRTVVLYCIPKKSARFCVVWRRRRFPSKPEVGVDGAIGAEPEAVFLYAGAPGLYRRRHEK